MTVATLDTIEDALFAALGGLVQAPDADLTDAKPLRFLDRYAGEVTREHGVDTTFLVQCPAALLAFEDARPLGADGAWAETGGHDAQVVGRSTWRVYVTVRDARDDAHALKSSLAGQPAALAVAQRVKVTLDGLAVPGLFDGRRVRWSQTAPWLILRRVAYVYAVRFAADAALPEAADPLPGVPLARVDGTLPDARRDTDGAEVTLARARTTP